MIVLILSVVVFCLVVAAILGACAIGMLKQEIVITDKVVDRLDAELVNLHKHVKYLLEKHG